MNRSLELLALSDDYTVIRATEYFNQKFLPQLTTGLESLLNSASIDGSPLLTNEEVQCLIENDNHQLSTADSQFLARHLLYFFACIPETSELVAQAIQHWNDDYKKVGVILTTGLVASLLLIVASTEFEYRDEKVYIHKQVLSDSQIRAMADVVSSYLSVTNEDTKTKK